MDNDFGFIPDAPAATNDFGFVPDKKDDVKSSLLGKLASSMANYQGRGATDVLAGTAQLGNTLLNVPHNVANFVNPKLGNMVSGYKPDYDYYKAMGVNNPGTFDKALGAAPQMLPYIAGGEMAGLSKAPAFITNLMKNSPALAQKAAGLAGMVGKNAAFGAGANVATGGDPTSGALIGGAGGLAGSAINSGVNALSASKLLGGATSPQELANNLNVTQGTNTPLGDVVNSPMLKRLYENVLTKIPLSGANDKLQQTSKQIVGQGNDIMGKLLGNNTAGDVGATLQKALKDKLNSLQQIKRDNYAMPNNIADEIGLKVGRDNFSKTAQNTLDEIKKSPELGREVEPSIVNDLQNYASQADGNSLKLSNIFKGKIGEKASDYFNDNKNYEYGIYKNLKDSLQKDIDDSITTSGDTSLKESHAQANQFYKENIAPFEDPAIVKFTKQGGDADTLLSSFIKPGTINDRGNLIKTLVNKLPDDQQHLPAYGWMSKALDQNGNVDPQKFARLYRNLGSKQKAALIPDVDLRQQMDNYHNLIGKNGSALNVMQNQSTGQKVMDLLPMVSGMVGYHVGGLGAGIASLGASAAISRPLTYLLTNPAVREKVVQQLINNKSFAPVGDKTLGGLAGLSAGTNNY